MKYAIITEGERKSEIKGNIENGKIERQRGRKGRDRK